MGDGLVHLVLARNLKSLGYDVVFYNNYMAELNDYLPGVSAKPFPDYESICDELSCKHLIIYESDAPYIRGLPDPVAKWFASNGICYSVSRKNPIHRRITENAVRRRLPEEFKSHAKRLVALNRKLPVRSLGLYRKPVAKQLADFIASKLKIENKTYSNGLQAPVTNHLSRSTRVVIHPTSGNPTKNWLPTRFLALAGRLQESGWVPVITVAPDERDRWLDFIDGVVEVPLLETVKDLANYYAQSAAFVGNDSGNAHLASCLGLPNLVIRRRWERFPRWRPGWAKPTIIFPRILNNRHWQKKVSVDRVHRAFVRMMSHSDPERATEKRSMISGVASRSVF